MNYFICSFYNIRIILYLEYKCITFFFVEILLRLDIWIHNSYFLAKRVLKSHETKVRSRKGSPFPILRSDNHERGRGGRRVGGGAKVRIFLRSTQQLFQKRCSSHLHLSPSFLPPSPATYLIEQSLSFAIHRWSRTNLLDRTTEKKNNRARFFRNRARAFAVSPSSRGRINNYKEITYSKIYPPVIETSFRFVPIPSHVYPSSFLPEERKEKRSPPLFFFHHMRIEKYRIRVI